MNHVDALSRAPVEPAENETVVEDRLLGIFSIVSEADEVLMYQRSDEDLKRKLSILRIPERECTNYERGEVNGYQLQEGIIYKEIDDKLLFVIPKAESNARSRPRSPKPPGAR